MITQADYDELLRLRGLGYQEIHVDAWGRKEADTLRGRKKGLKKGLFRKQVPYGIGLNIAAAIAEYDRAQEGK